MALERSGDPDERESREVAQVSPVTPALLGFTEQTVLFRDVLELPLELRPLRHRLEPEILRWAAARGEAIQIDPALVIARSEALDEEAMLALYAAALGVGIDPLQDRSEGSIDVSETLRSGELPAQCRAGHDLPTLALFGGRTKRAFDRVTNGDRNFRITSARRLRLFAERRAAAGLAEEAANGLRRREPSLSAATRTAPAHLAVWLSALALVALSLCFAPGATRFAFEIILAVIFLSWAGLRIFACLAGQKENARKSVTDAELPTYSVLIPLYREARVVSELVASISALNYPREKLDVKLILEPDDGETIAAVKSIALDPCFEIVYACDLAPRTKPKALRSALPFVRGDFLVIYDAEDRPHPDQLREAYAAFIAGDTSLACVQARLAVDNLAPSFLTGHFRAEYAGLFDVLLPALARLRIPIPLGGTSNHFRVSALERVGAWDPHNVTEDADLGVRLSRFGYTTDVLRSTTWEEAPARLAVWLPQRTRWFKGWLQTYLVHMRDPALLGRQLGWRGFLAFQLLIGGSVLAALVHPIFAFLLLADSAWGSLLSVSATPPEWAHKALIFTTLMSGYIASGLLALIGLKRRGALASAWVLIAIPIYWLLLSAAAWRAAWKLATAPHEWEKTAHGVAKRATQNAT